MDVRLTWTDCDKAGDYVVPNVLSPKDLVSRPDNMDTTVLLTHEDKNVKGQTAPHSDCSQTSSLIRVFTACNIFSVYNTVCNI